MLTTEKATADTGDSPPEQAATTKINTFHIRWALFAVWLVATAVLTSTRGIPFERIQILGWIAVGLAISTIGRGRGGVLTVLADFVPLAVVMALYDLSRGVADTLGMPIQMQSLVNLERWIFRGTIPTVWAQERLGPYTGPVRWWEVPVALSYISHFFVPFAVMGGFWLLGRDHYWDFTKRFLALTMAGLSTYVLLPGAPPWMASENGLIGDVQRVSTRGLSLLNLNVADSFIRYGSEFANEVAALPSLHAGWATVVSVYFLRFTPKWAWPLLLAHPLFMGVTIVISGEHYVVDVLMGYAYAVAAIKVFDYLDKRRTAKVG